MDIDSIKEWSRARSNGRATEIVIKKWKTITTLPGTGSQNTTAGEIRVRPVGYSEPMPNRKKTVQLSREIASGRVRNDKTIKKEINNDIIAGQNSLEPVSSRSNRRKLALELSQALQDPKGLAFYLSCASNYSEELLRRILAEVKEKPEHKIKKTRGALFNYLVQRSNQRN